MTNDLGFAHRRQNMAGQRHGGGLPRMETPGHVSAAGRALGLLLSRALSSRLPGLIIAWVAAGSSWILRQEVVDFQVLADERHTTPQSVRRLLRRESLEAAVADAIVLAKVTVNR